MSKTDRGALYALGVALLAIVMASWFSQPINQATPTQKSAGVEQREQDDVSRIVTAIREFDPWNDTYAQWLMAAFGVAATFISYRAVTLVRDTLELNLKATNAALAANEISRDTAIRELRAYVSITRIQFRDMASTNPNWVIEFANSGATPAKRLSVDIWTAIGEGPSQGKIFRKRAIGKIDRDDESVADIPANSKPVKIEGGVYRDMVDVEEWEMVERGRKKLLIVGIIRYRDVFNITRRTIFKAEYDPSTLNADGHGKGAVTRTGNRTS